MQNGKPGHVSAGSVEARQDRLLFCSCEGDTGDLLRGLEHVDGDDVGVLRCDGEGLGHEGGAEAHRRQAREEMPPVERDSYFVHIAFTIARFLDHPENAAAQYCGCKLVRLSSTCPLRLVIDVALPGREKRFEPSSNVTSFINQIGSLAKIGTHVEKQRPTVEQQLPVA